MKNFTFALLGLIAGVVVGYTFTADCNTSVKVPKDLVMRQVTMATAAECREMTDALNKLVEGNTFGVFTNSPFIDYSDCPLPNLIR